MIAGIGRKIHLGESFRQKVVILHNFYSFLLSLIFPIEAIITLLFWCLYMYDPRLLMSKELYDNNIRVSLFSNLCLHLFPFILLCIEIVETPLKRKNFHLVCLAMFGATYYFWISFTAYKNKKWAYPFLDNLNWYGRILVIICVTLVGLIFYEFLMFGFKNIKAKRE